MRQATHLGPLLRPLWGEMTDDELHALWLAGHPVEAIAQHASRSRAAIRGRIKRLRAKDPEAWPIRTETQHAKGSGAGRYQKKRVGASTLPPLPSLTR